MTLSFTDLPVEPIAPKAEQLATALFELIDARAALNESEDKIPAYTAQWSREDYVKDERHAYNLAANKFLSVLTPATAE